MPVPPTNRHWRGSPPLPVPKINRHWFSNRHRVRASHSPREHLEKMRHSRTYLFLCVHLPLPRLLLSPPLPLFPPTARVGSSASGGRRPAPPHLLPIPRPPHLLPSGEQRRERWPGRRERGLRCDESRKRQRERGRRVLDGGKSGAGARSTVVRRIQPRRRALDGGAVLFPFFPFFCSSSSLSFAISCSWWI